MNDASLGNIRAWLTRYAAACHVLNNGSQGSYEISICADMLDEVESRLSSGAWADCYGSEAFPCGVCAECVSDAAEVEASGVTSVRKVPYD